MTLVLEIFAGRPNPFEPMPAGKKVEIDFRYINRHASISKLYKLAQRIVKQTIYNCMRNNKSHNIHMRITKHIRNSSGWKKHSRENN